MKELRPLIEPYTRSEWRRPIGQLINTLIPFFLLWYLMLRSLEVSYWLTLGLAVVAAGFNMRIFIFFHDCGHNSFFPSTKVNRIVGSILGIFSMTPGEQWWKSHAIHHATNGNLDKRGVGDVMTLTVDEYLQSPWWKKFFYRVIRNPFFMLVFGPIVIFVLTNRFTMKGFGKKEKLSVLYMNIALAVIITGLCLLVGWKQFLLVHFPITLLSGMIGIWLFYVQHQFDDAYWVRSERWDYVEAALSGASFYKMPGFMNWFSGNIAYHHIHHLNPRIPNYLLDRCYEDNKVFQEYAPEIPFVEGFKSMGLALWDEEQGHMVGFHEIKGRKPSVQPADLRASGSEARQATGD